MITLRTSPFDLLDRLEQQVSQAERVPAAEVIETNTSYTVRLELPGVDHESIDVKATDRSLVISAERQPTIPTGRLGGPAVCVQWRDWSERFCLVQQIGENYTSRTI